MGEHDHASITEKVAPRNNSLRGDDAGNEPMPRDFQGGNSDFGVVRTLDGHFYGPNVHYPNASRTLMDETDEVIEGY